LIWLVSLKKKLKENIEKKWEEMEKKIGGVTLKKIKEKEGSLNANMSNYSP
jgi:hypothetical protein